MTKRFKSFDDLRAWVELYITDKTREYATSMLTTEGLDQESVDEHLDDVWPRCLPAWIRR